MSFALHEATIAQLQAAMTAGQVTSAALTRPFLQRIETYDRAGPRLNSVLETNPEAIEIAEGLDREPVTGPLGPLHGIPVLLKDNIATAEAPTARAGPAGALAPGVHPHEPPPAAAARTLKRRPGRRPGAAAPPTSKNSHAAIPTPQATAPPGAPTPRGPPSTASGRAGMTADRRAAAGPSTP